MLRLVLIIAICGFQNVHAGMSDDFYDGARQSRSPVYWQNAKNVQNKQRNSICGKVLNVQSSYMKSFREKLCKKD